MHRDSLDASIAPRPWRNRVAGAAVRTGMLSGEDKRLERRAARAAESALAERKLVTPIDVLTGLGWLHPAHLDP